MESNNVITFPKENKNIKKSATIEEINENVEQMNMYHIHETIGNLIPIVFTHLEIAGFNPSDEQIEEDVRDMAFFVESLKSMLCKHHGIYHPFQVLSDKIFEEELTEEGALKIVDEITIDLKEQKED